MNLESIYSTTILILFISAPVIFFTLFFYTAPYGRYATRTHGIRVKSAWFWMELPAVLIILVFFVVSSQKTAGAIALLILWQTHYIYRTFIYTRLMREGRDKHFPFFVGTMAFVFNCMNGYVNGYRLFLSDRIYPAAWIVDVRFIFGALLFILGFLIHIESDRTLRVLRKKNETSYSIPEGRLFNLVSAPNYLGEIVQWTGWAIASWSLAGLAFAVFTVANLLPRAVSHHRWYRKTFDDYPKKRKAVIPFVL